MAIRKSTAFELSQEELQNIERAEELIDKIIVEKIQNGITTIIISDGDLIAKGMDKSPSDREIGELISRYEKAEWEVEAKPVPGQLGTILTLK